MKCPECGSTSQFVVESADTAEHMTVDSNCVNAHGVTIEAEEFSDCECVDCGYTADVSDFQEEDMYEDLDDDVDYGLDTDSLLYDCVEDNDSPESELDDGDSDLFEEYRECLDGDDEEWD